MAAPVELGQTRKPNRETSLAGSVSDVCRARAVRRAAGIYTNIGMTDQAVKMYDRFYALTGFDIKPASLTKGQTS